MKRLTLAVALAITLVLIGFLASSTWGPDASPNTDYAQTHRGHLLRLDANAASGRVIFLGSSTLQGLDATPITPFALNLGLGGDTVQQLAQRSKDYRSLQKAAAIVLNIGFNDVIQNCHPPLSEALDTLFAQLPRERPLIVVGLQGVSPERQRQGCSGRISEHLSSANIDLAQRCAALPLCRFVPNPIKERLDAHASSQLHESDGIHLSPMAYDLLRTALHETLRALAPELTSYKAAQ